MQRFRLTLISHVWKFARRSNVFSDFKILRKTSCVRSSASSCLPTNLYAMLNTLRQCRRTMLSHAAWSPPRHRWMMSSIGCGSVGRASADMHGERGHDDGNARMITCETLVPQPFQANDTGLLCDGVSVPAIAEAAGTPVYIYSAQAIRDAYRSIDEAFAGYPHAIHYALKANST